MGGTSQPASGASEKLIVQWAGHQYRAINRKTQKDAYIYMDYGKLWSLAIPGSPLSNQQDSLC